MPSMTSPLSPRGPVYIRADESICWGSRYFIGEHEKLYKRQHIMGVFLGG